MLRFAKVKHIGGLDDGHIGTICIHDDSLNVGDILPHDSTFIREGQWSVPKAHQEILKFVPDPRS